MSATGLLTDITELVNVIAMGDHQQLEQTTRLFLSQGSSGDTLLGRLGVLASHADTDGHPILTISAAAAICRWLTFAPRENQAPENYVHQLPVVVPVLAAYAPLIRQGKDIQINKVDPIFPSGLSETKTVAQALRETIDQNDPTTVERLLMGLYGTGADYRELQARLYGTLIPNFSDEGHPLAFAVRGTQVLDMVEWGRSVPDIVHWMIQHVMKTGNQPAWMETVRGFLADPSYDFSSLRVRLALPKEEHALPVRTLVLSDAPTAQVCQGIYDAIMKQGASAHGVASMLNLAAADLLQMVGDEDAGAFIRVAHGLLFTSALRNIFIQNQFVEMVPLLFTGAAYINALRKELGQQPGNYTSPSTHGAAIGGGLIAPSMLETVREQLMASDVNGAFLTTRRFIQLGYDPRALFATIGLIAAQQSTITADQGHMVQITQAAGSSFLEWPHSLSNVEHDSFLHIALRAATNGSRRA